MNGALPVVPHDEAVRRAAQLLSDGSPMVKTGYACNLACTYCCVKPDGNALLPADTLHRVVDALHALGYGGIGYMGGEPTIHPAFLDIVRHAATCGYQRQLLATNGVRLADAGLTARLFEAGINAVTLSLDSFDEKVQEPLYGVRSLHGKALAGLHNVLAAPGVDLLVSAVVTAPVAAHLPAYLEEVDRLQHSYGKEVGVMLCLLQPPAGTGPAQQALPLGLVESARLTNLALDRAQALGVPVITFGFPPCVLEGHEQNASELYMTEWVVDVATGAVERSLLGYDGTYWAPCATCPHAGYCPGVMKPYADADTRAFVAARAGGGSAPRPTGRT